MWALKVLNGSLAGKSFPLQKGKNLIGRGTTCNIQIPENGISKEHAEVEMNRDIISIKDLQSRNGVFVNGTKIQTQLLRIGDKLLIHNVLLQVEQSNALVSNSQKNQQRSLTPTQNRLPQMQQRQNLPAMSSPQAHQIYQHPIPQMPGGYQQVSPSGQVHTQSQKSIWERLSEYIESTALPAVYHLTTIFEYKIVFGILMGFFALALTALSLIPMIAITSESIDTESRRRAFTIARNMANLNQIAILSGNENNINVNGALAEEGVDEAYIIRDSDGSVIAPAEQSGNVPNISLIEKARSSKNELSEKTPLGQIIVTVPISMFSADAGTYVTKAHAVLVYNMGSLSMDDGRILALFIQTLFLASLLGLFVFFLMYKLVEYPYKEIDLLLDNALREKKETISFNLDFPVLKEFISKINTALGRAALAGDDAKPMNINRELEAENVAKMIGYAALAIKQDLTILAANEHFQSLLALNESQLKHQPVALIPDQALQKNIIDLIERCSNDFGAIAINELEFGGNPYQLSAQAISGDRAIEYYIISFVQMGGTG